MLWFFVEKPKIVFIWKAINSEETRKEEVILEREETIVEIFSRVLLFSPPVGMKLWEARYHTSVTVRPLVLAGVWQEP